MFLFHARGFLIFHLNVKVAKDLIKSCLEDHIFGPTNVSEHLPEEELTPGRNRF